MFRHYPMTQMKYSRAVLNSKPEYIFIEYVSLHVLKFVIENLDRLVRIGGKKRDKYEMDYLRRILSVILDAQVNGFYPVVHRNSDCGRVSAVEGISLQTCWRLVRQVLSFGLYTDVDIHNCHPTILYNMAVSNEVNTPFLRQYVTEREKAVGEIGRMNPDMCGDMIKRNILAIMNGGSSFKKMFKRMDFIDGFQRDARRMRCFLAPGENFTHQKTIMSKEIMNVENSHLQDCVELVRLNNPKTVLVLIYDGFQVGSEVNSDDLIKSLDELKLRVSFKVKQMKECLRVMEMIKSSGNRLESKVPYEKLNMKKIMEKVKSNSEVRVLI